MNSINNKILRGRWNLPTLLLQIFPEQNSFHSPKLGIHFNSVGSIHHCVIPVLCRYNSFDLNRFALVENWSQLVVNWSQCIKQESPKLRPLTSYTDHAFSVAIPKETGMIFQILILMWKVQRHDNHLAPNINQESTLQMKHDIIKPFHKILVPFWPRPCNLCSHSYLCKCYHIRLVVFYWYKWQHKVKLEWKMENQAPGWGWGWGDRNTPGAKKKWFQTCSMPATSSTADRMALAPLS